jgi:hypothetical protein
MQTMDQAQVSLGSEAAVQAMMTLELHPRRTVRDMNEHSGSWLAGDGWQLLSVQFFCCLSYVLCVKETLKCLASIGLTTFMVYTKLWVFVMS